MKNIAVLGSTGSIGTKALKIIENNSDMRAVALSCGRNIKLLEEQIRRFKPYIVSCERKEDADCLRASVKDIDCKVTYGMEGLIECATFDKADMVLTAVVGMMGILPTIEAIKHKKTIALANKETLVTAGQIIMPLAKDYGVSILPVDSEHSAIFQSLQGIGDNKIFKILLTASGGPFRTYTREQLKNVTLKDALKHPNWAMGKKVTIDSSTMVNKGLEVMEAKWLFNVPLSDIRVVIHPESILHSAIELDDGAIIGQMGIPDMALPIQYAFTYPERREGITDRLDLFKVGKLTFFEPDLDLFKGLRLAFKAAECGGNMPTVFNAANEEAVKLFIDEKIKYLEILDIIENAMENVKTNNADSLDKILSTQNETIEYINSRWK